MSDPRRVLVVDDEEGMLEVVADTLATVPDLEVELERDPRRAAEKLAERRFDLLISDVRMPGMDGVELLRIARERDPSLPVLMLTAFPSVETAVESMKLGARDYVTKPFLPDDLRTSVKRILAEERLRQENTLLARHVERGYVFDEIIGASAPMRRVFDTIERVAGADVDVLVVGETGTGKELVARSLHARSARRERRFVPVDCGAIPESLLESELFGHEKGAFTGATHRNLGLIELADGGTLFLDEIGELPLPLQSKLLRVLQERRFRRVGGREEIDVDVRIVAATNRDLPEEVRGGRFREDLYYRIHVVVVELPPLRDRPGDVALLARHFVARYAKEMGRPVRAISGEALEILERYSWPGNVRELNNSLKRAVALCRGEEITAEDLPDEIVMHAAGQERGSGGGFFAERTRRVEAFERDYLDALLVVHRGDVTAAAQEAKVPRGTLYRLLKKHGISPDDYRPRSE